MHPACRLDAVRARQHPAPAAPGRTFPDELASLPARRRGEELPTFAAPPRSRSSGAVLGRGSRGRVERLCPRIFLIELPRVAGRYQHSNATCCIRLLNEPIDDAESIYRHFT